MAKLTFAHFEIIGDDVPGLSDFYETVTGWKADPVGFIPDYTMLLEDGTVGMTGAIMADEVIKQPTIVWFGTEDIEQSVRDVMGAGGSKFNEIHAIPDGRKVVYVRDPAGNLLGLTQNPPG